MFTGIITAIGNIAAVHPTAGGARIRVAAPGLGLTDGQVGESIAVNGVCLTAIAISADGFDADVSRETLRCTCSAENRQNVTETKIVVTLFRQLLLAQRVKHIELF